MGRGPHGHAGLRPRPGPRPRERRGRGRRSAGSSPTSAGPTRSSAPGGPTATCSASSTRRSSPTTEPGLHPWLADVTELCLEAEDRTDGLFTAWRRSARGRAFFDPTGLVKGWAVAAAAEHLALVPGATWAVGAGGDVAVGAGPGPADDPAPWRVGIEDPRDPRRVVDVVELRRGGVATSGAARRGAHVVDPRTGAGITRSGSATVVGPDLLWADVWATAAWVDPTRAARLLAERDPAYRLMLA